MDSDRHYHSDRDDRDSDSDRDTKMADDKPSYRSWKKKYRKMRLVFDQKMHEGEQLHKDEQRALETARRLAVEKDRLLDLLLDVNNSAQIPPTSRIDLSLSPPPSPSLPSLPIDHPSTSVPINHPSTSLPTSTTTPSGLKSYRHLLTTIPHSTYTSISSTNLITPLNHFLTDLSIGRDSPADPHQGAAHPPSFLTADDIDNYIYEIDTRLAETEYGSTGRVPNLLPTLAPIAGEAAKDGNANATISTMSRDFALRNPTSVYNWLRKHAPKTFLQDGEGGAAADREDEPGTGGRGGRGEGKRGGGGGRGSGRGKRGGRKSAAAVAAAAAGEDGDEDTTGTGVFEATPSGGKGKRKRMVDDDPGYRPKGGSSRPGKKKKRGSEEGGVPVEKERKAPRKSGGVNKEGFLV